MQTLLDRFCRYVRIDTEANEKSTTYPSTPGQLELGRLLASELRAMGPLQRFEWSNPTRIGAKVAFGGSGAKPISHPLDGMSARTYLSAARAERWFLQRCKGLGFKVEFIRGYGTEEDERKWRRAQKVQRI